MEHNRFCIPAAEFRCYYMTMRNNNIHHIRYYVIGMLLSLFVTGVSAKHYYFRNINSNQGLSSNSVNAIYRDSKGFLWIGTNQGLNCYDGYQIKTFKANPIDTKSIANNYINNINEDPEGFLWIENRSGYSVFDFHNESCVKNFVFMD